MQNKFYIVLSLIILFSVSIFANENAEILAKQAISEDANESQIAIRSLREMNQAGLDALVKVYSNEIANYAKTGQKTASWQKISNAIDSVAMQKDAYASKLFWHTDFEKAQAEAQKTNKPILSLRLLGNLNEEYSCANSRFFRSTLYSNAEISKYLRENYVLHWKSVRPAPKVTIDFGDGRKIERTLTGNSIHYVLNKDGRVMDALPGLNSPHIFQKFLLEAGQVVIMSESPVNKFTPEAKTNYINMYRSSNYRNLRRKINNAGKQLELKFDTNNQSSRNLDEMPSAMLASSLAVTKSVVEVNILNDITPDVTRFGNEQINFDQWKQIAVLTKNDAKLDAQSIAFIHNQTASNKLSDKQFNELIKNLETYISVDTARNDFLMRLNLLTWLNKGLDHDVEKLNEKVYAKLFLTPYEDKWLGLYAPELYTALDGNGLSN